MTNGSLIKLLLTTWTILLILGSIFGGTLRAIGPLIITAAIIIMTALANTAIGKIALVAIASWSLVNIWGVAITDVETMTQLIYEDPQLAIEYALSWFL